jgi:hypothetical protein
MLAAPRFHGASDADANIGTRRGAVWVVAFGSPQAAGASTGDGGADGIFFGVCCHPVRRCRRPCPLARRVRRRLDAVPAGAGAAWRWVRRCHFP